MVSTHGGLIKRYERHRNRWRQHARLAAGRRSTAKYGQNGGCATLLVLLGFLLGATLLAVVFAVELITGDAATRLNSIETGNALSTAQGGDDVEPANEIADEPVDADDGTAARFGSGASSADDPAPLSTIVAPASAGDDAALGEAPTKPSSTAAEE